MKLQKIVWGAPLLILLLGVGIWLMVLLRGLPIRKLFWAVGLAAGKESRRGNKSLQDTECQGISPFASLATELAATIGTGNIVGVVSAMYLGGPGALVWMIISAVLGLATKLVESSLSVKYRKRKEEGGFSGGPMITLERAFPFRKTGRILAYVYAGLAVCCAFGMGNMVQANSVSAALENAFGVAKSRTGFFLTLMTVLVILGGVKSIAGMSAFLVPAMGILYLGGCVGIIITHWQNMMPALAGILQAAFFPRAVSGGIFGTVTVSLADSVKWGVSRGVFSNEAGLGAAGITAAASREAEPVRQGFISMTGVFFDTILICTVTGIAYACSGVAGMTVNGQLHALGGRIISAGDGAGMMMAAFGTSYGRGGEILLGICIALFAYATILGWACQGEEAFCYLFGENRKQVFRFLYGLLTFPGALFSMELIWALSDICNGLLALPNLICLLFLGAGMCGEIRKNCENVNR